MFEIGYMRSDCAVHVGELDIFDTMIGTSLFDDFTYGGVMNMRYFGEQMMFYLKIQATNQPGNESVMCGKIGSRIHLVDRPFIFNFVSINICEWK